MIRLHDAQRTGRLSQHELLIPNSEMIEVQGLDAELAVRSLGRVFFLPGRRMSKKLLQLVDLTEEGKLSADVLVFANLVASDLLSRQSAVPEPRDYLLRTLTTFQRRSSGAEELQRQFLSDEFVEIVGQEDWLTFDANAWHRPDHFGPRYVYAF